MMNFALAVSLDIEGRVEDAADAYENIIANQSPPKDAFLNLACLYWDCTDPGVSSGLQLEIDFFTRAGNRMYEVLREGQLIFGNLPEFTFWKLYFDFITLGEEPLTELALKLAESSTENLVPYFHVYTQTEDEKYLPYVRQLFDQIFEEKTTKNRYIISIIREYLTLPQVIQLTNSEVDMAKKLKPLKKVRRAKAINFLSEVLEADFTGYHSSENVLVSVSPTQEGYLMRITDKKMDVKFIADLGELWDVMSEYGAFTEWKFKKYEMD